MAAGLPHKFWSYAITYFALCSNARSWHGKSSAWQLRHGEPYDHDSFPLLPFGCLVDYRPSDLAKSQSSNTGKFAYNGSGIWLGYDMQTGGKINGKAIIVPLEEFVGLNWRTCRRDAYTLGVGDKAGTMYIDECHIKEVKYTPGQWQFPLQKEWSNSTKLPKA